MRRTRARTGGRNRAEDKRTVLSHKSGSTVFDMGESELLKQRILENGTDVQNQEEHS